MWMAWIWVVRSARLQEGWKGRGAGAYLGAGEMEQNFSALTRFGPRVPKI